MNQSLFNQAMKYRSLDWSVIPVNFSKAILVDGKIKKQFNFLPTYRQYHSEKMPVEQIKVKWEGYNSIAVITGEISGITGLDIDCKDLPEMGDLPETLTVETYKGYHFLFKYTPELETVAKTFMRDDKEFNIDIRNNGGILFADPSEYELPDGTIAKYKIIKDIPPADFPIEWLRSIYRKYKPEEINGKGEFVKSDWKEKLVGPIVEGSRNNDFISIIGGLISRFREDEWESIVWPLIQDKNKLQEKPLPIIELRAKFEGIIKKDRQSRGRDSEPVDFTPFTLADLYGETFPPARWIVKDLIPLGTIVALTGDSNSYKTFLTQAMAASVVSGEPFLGHFATTPGKVLILDEENHRMHIQDRFKQMGVNPTADLLFLSLKGVKIDNEQHLEALKELLDKEKPALVIFDSLVRFHKGEENSATEMAKAFSGMKKLVADDRAILFIHHHRKPQNFAKKSTSQSIRGSSDIIAAIDAHLAIDRRDSDFIITQTKMRLQPEIKPFKAALALTLEGKRIFTYQGTDTTEEDLMQLAYDAVKNALAQSNEPLSVEMLAAETTLPMTKLRQALKDLVKSKEAIIAKTGAHGTHFYELVITD